MAEVLASSKELSILLAKQIQSKMVNLADVLHVKLHHVGVASKEISKPGMSLLHIQARHNDHTFLAVLDSDSEVSLIYEDIWK